MCPQQELGHELPVCPLLMSWGCCVPAPAPTAAPCHCRPSPGGGTLRTGPWKQQNNPPFHLAASSSALPLLHGRQERAALPLPKLLGLKWGVALAPALGCPQARWRREGAGWGLQACLYAVMLLQGENKGSDCAESSADGGLECSRCRSWEAGPPGPGAGVSLLLSPCQNQVPFEQVLPGLELGPGGPGWPGDWRSGAALKAGSAETQHRDRAATAGSMLNVACRGDVCRAALRGVLESSSVTSGAGNSSDRPRGMGDCPQSPRDVKRGDVMALVCLDLLICPAQHEYDHQPWVCVAPPWLLGSGVHVGVPVQEWGQQVTASFSLG